MKSEFDCTIKKGLGLSGALTEGARRRMRSGLLPALLIIFAFVMFFSAGINMGRPELLGSLNYDYDGTDGFDDDSGSVTVGDTDLSVAGAASDNSSGQTSTVSQTFSTSYINKTEPFTYTSDPGAKMRSRWYWAGNSSTNNRWTGVGAWRVWGSGTVRQKEIIMSGYVYVSLGGVLGELARNGLLTISSAWAKLETGNGSDQDVYWGVCAGYVDPTNNNSFPGGNQAGSIHRTGSGGSDAGNNSFNYDLPKNTTGITIMMRARTNYTSWIGGRLPDGKISNIRLTFKTRDNTDPQIVLDPNSVASWAKSKNVKVTVTDTGGSGSPMHTSQVSGTNSSGKDLTEPIPSGNVYTYKDVASSLSVKYQDRSGEWSNDGAWETWSLAKLKIDRSAPVIDSVSFCKTGTPEAITGPYNGTVDLRVAVSDTGSGIKSVTIKNTSVSGNLSTRTETVSTTGTTSKTFTFSNVQNGRYTINVVDHVNWNATQETRDFVYKDTQAPTVSVSLAATGPNNYAKGPIEATFTVSDETGDSSSVFGVTNFQNTPGIKSFSVVQNGGAALNYTTVTNNAYANGVRESVYKVYLPFSGTYTFTAVDNAGNSESSGRINGATGSNVTAYIDTSAPRALSVTAAYAGSDATRKWVSGDVTLTVSVTDIPTTTTANKGSGLKSVTIYDRDTSAVVGTYNFTGAPQNDTATFNLTANYNQIPYYTILITDCAGNTSKLAPGWHTVNKVRYENYFINDKTLPDTVTVYKDANPVSVEIWSADKSACYAKNGEIYTFPWTRAANEKYMVKMTFGPSGGNLFEIVAGADRAGTLATHASANVNPEYNNAANVRWTEISQVAQGAVDYVYRFTNGAGVNALSGKAITRMDRTAPVVNFLGFGTGFSSGSYTTVGQITDRIEGFISERDFYGTTKWSRSSLYAYIVISDTYSGVDGGAQSNSKGSQSSLAKAQITFKHNGYTFTLSSNFYERQGAGGLYVLPVKLWDLDDIRDHARNASGNSIVRADGKLDVLYGQGIPFVYNIVCSDFIGNVCSVTDSGNKADLSYNVDPFAIRAEVESIKTVSQSGATADYDSSAAGKSWTRDKIVVTINKTQMGLSPMFIEYATRIVTDQPDGSTSDMSTAPTSAWSTGGMQDSGTSAKAVLTLDADSRSDQLFFRARNSVSVSEADSPDGRPKDMVTFLYYKGEYIIIRQDVDAPTLISFFFSTKADIASNPYDASGALDGNILLFYAAEVRDGVYTVVRTTGNNDLKDVFVYRDVYLYVMATDYTGVGMGSGINFIEITSNGRKERLYTYDQGATPSSRVWYDSGTKNGLYRSNLTYGYAALREEYGLEFRLADNQNNGSDRNYPVTKDTDGHKLLPIVDRVIPSVSIETATYGSQKKSYLTDGRFAGDENTPIRETLDVSFRYIAGISDAKIYVRQRDFGVALSPGNPVLIHNSDRLSSKYGFVADAGIDLAEWIYIGDGTTSGATGDGGSLWDYRILADAASIKDRYDVLIVSGTGVYYYIDAGDVFIDTVPPTIHNELTFYALAGSALNGAAVIDYESLEKVTLSDFTNDDVYAYFRITDAASGVAAVNYHVSQNETVALDKVIVRRNVSGTIVEEEYYRLLMSANRDYKIEAVDKAGNSVESGTFKPSIDKNEIDLKITTAVADGGAYVSGRFTNSSYIKITLDVGCGLSGFDRVEYSTDGKIFTVLSQSNLLNQGAWTGAGTQKARVSFIFTEEQNQQYIFRAYNGIADEHAAGGVAPVSEKSVVFAIDRTAPEIYKNDPGSNILFVEGTWHNEGQVLKLKIEDPNEYGSGIASIRMNYRLGNLAQETVEFVKEGDGYYYSRLDNNDFTLDHYADYTITLTDNAGNRASVTVRPLIDSVRPTFGEFGGQEKHQLQAVPPAGDGSVSETVPYTAGTWTKTDVEALLNIVYSISGARLEFSRAASDGRNFGAWSDWYGADFDWNNPAVTDSGATRIEAGFGMLFAVEAERSLDYTYRVRIIGGSGLVSEELTLGRIMIDKVTPVIDVRVRVNSNYTDYGTHYDTETVIDGWTENYIYINVNTPSTLVSGYSIYYNIRQSGEPDWQRITNGFTSNKNFEFDYSRKTLVHTLDDTVNNHTYQYYFESNSGMRSEIYTVKGLKIDRATPSFIPEARVSDVYGTAQDGGRFNTANESDYAGSGANYNLTNPVWTNRNSVVIRISIERMNISGMRLFINDLLYDTFDGGESVPLSRYYVVSKTSDLRIRLLSGAGVAYTQEGRVWIDNEIPMLYVAGVRGVRSTNWDGTFDNSWYTNATNIDFKVGTLVKDGSDYIFSDATSASGFTVEYTVSTDADESKWEWRSNGGSNVLTILGNPYEQNTYRFRIVSGSGMTFTLGKGAYDNSGAPVATADDIGSLVAGANGLVRHLSDSDFVYRFNVDSNTYYINSAQLIELNVNGADRLVTSADFASYSYEKFLNGAYVPLDAARDYEFKRGDLIRVSYTTADYIHRFTDYGVKTADGWTEGRKERYDGTADNERAGSFEFRFSDSSVAIDAYFIKELDVAYAGTIMYKQSQTSAAVTAQTTFTYKTDGGATTTVPIPLEVAYFDMDGNGADGGNLSLGGYIVRTTVVGSNAASFRLTNPATVLLVKYFTEKIASDGSETVNSGSNPYTIENSGDLLYVPALYYKDYEKTDAGFVLGEALSYLDSHFRLASDIELTEAVGIAGRFSGSFNGAGFTVTMAGGRRDGDYGFFEELAGDVFDAAFELADPLTVYDAGNVGILASEITGGSVRNVRVSGDMEIITALRGANVGGLAGRAEHAQIGGYTSNATYPVFAEVVIYNYGNELAEVNIGGLIGYAGEQIKLFHTYTYSHITVYNVPGGVKAGAVIGASATTSYAGDAVYDSYFNNRYLSGNVFLNDELRTGFIGVSSDINNENESRNTVQGLTFAELTGTSTGHAGTVYVAGKAIRTAVLDRLYADFGLEKAEGAYAEGTGVKGDPLVISDARRLRAADKYMNLYYTLEADLDMAEFGAAIGLHKVFAGEFDGNGHKLTSFGDGYELADGDRIGLFAELSGKVISLVFDDARIAYNGNSDVLYAGLVAAKSSGGIFGDVIAVGNIDISNASGEVYAGTVTGYADGGTIYDAFGIVNVKASAAVVYAGGIAGYADGMRMGAYADAYGQVKDGAVFSLGRVEANAVSVFGGSVIADGSLAADSGAVYAVSGNAYSNGIVTNRSVSDAVLSVSFDSTAMRNTAFSDGTNVFNKVFKTDKLYYLSGSGTASDKFAVTNETEFAYIEHMLYANYNIADDIDFSDFRTIGEGLVFTGSIDGKNADSWSAEDGTVSSLMNVTSALVYNNAGSVTDLGINVYYEKTVDGEDLVFGAVAVYNSTGTIRNVTVGGNIEITSVNRNSTVTVSGFVGISTGGIIDGDSKVQNSISGLNIRVVNAGTVYAGGYIGRVDGMMTLSYGIGSGAMEIDGCGTVYAGTLVGAAYKECNWSSLEETADYRYIVTVDGEIVDKLFGFEAR